MKSKTGLVVAGLLVVGIAAGAVFYANGSDLQGRMGKKPKSGSGVVVDTTLPDLIPDPAKTTLLVTGSGVIDSSGVVVSVDLTFTGTCGLKDNGPNAVSGTQNTDCSFNLPSEDSTTVLSVASGNLSGEISMAGGDAVDFEASGTLDASSTADYLMFLQPLHDTFISKIVAEYGIDTGMTISEVDEFNNKFRHDIIVDGSAVVWTNEDGTTDETAGNVTPPVTEESEETTTEVEATDTTTSM